MGAGARTPEELETLLEDAFVIRDREALAELFEDGAVVATGDGLRQARGAEAIEHLAAAMWERGDGSYLPAPGRVLQERDTALVVAAQSINVIRRGSDGAWRYAIALLSLDEPTTKGAAMTRETDHKQALDPIAVRSDEGEARWWLGLLAVIKATAADTGGQMTIVEVTNPPGWEAPLHVHHREDEGFWILEGDAVIDIGDRTIQAREGDYVFGPRDIPHRYTAGEAGCQMLFILTPGGFEDLVRDMSVPAASRTLPPPSDEEPDLERVAAIARAYGAELVT